MPLGSRRSRQRRGNKPQLQKYIFFFSGCCFFWKNNLTKFGNFGNFELFFFLFTMVSIGKVSFSAKVPFWPHWWVENFLRKKKLDFGFEIFHIFYAKKRPFFRFLDPPYFRAGGPIFFSAFH